MIVKKQPEATVSFDTYKGTYSGVKIIQIGDLEFVLTVKTNAVWDYEERGIHISAEASIHRVLLKDGTTLPEYTELP